MTTEIIEHLKETIASTTSILVRDYATMELITFETALTLQQSQENSQNPNNKELTITIKRDL